jgi:GntR family transcriptional repressor for pyruvate dehydrogenase complex
VENWDEAESKITSEDCNDILKVLEFRRILEPAACRLAVENCTDETIAELETYLQQMTRFKGDRVNFVQADLQFHEAICRASGNSLLEKSLHKVFTETKKKHEQMNELFGYETGIHCHTEILDAFRKRDAQAAYDRMFHHLDEIPYNN